MTLLCSPDTTINKACGHLLFTRFNIVILLSWHRSEGPAQVFAYPDMASCCIGAQDKRRLETSAQRYTTAFFACVILNLYEVYKNVVLYQGLYSSAELR